MLSAAFETLGLATLKRHHQVRYAVGTWAPVAVELARHPELQDHAKLQVWTRDSTFFLKAQLDEWKEMLGGSTGNGFKLIARVLGQCSTHELETVYCVSWSILMLVVSLRIELSLRDC